VTVVSTHCHFDHIGGAHEFDCRLGHRLEASVHANPTLENTATTGFVRAETFKAVPYEGFIAEDYRVKAAPLTGYLDEGEVVDLGNRHFHILHLPAIRQVQLPFTSKPQRPCLVEMLYMMVLYMIRFITRIRPSIEKVSNV